MHARNLLVARLGRAVFPAALAGLALWPAAAPAAPAAPRTTAAIEAGQDARFLVERQASGRIHVLRPAERVCPDAATPAEAARRILGAEHRLLGLGADLGELKPLREQASLTGYHLRFSQTWQDLPVWRSSLVVHLDRDRCLTKLDANLTAIDGLDTAGRLGADDALAFARAELERDPVGKGGDKMGKRGRERQLDGWSGAVELVEPPVVEKVVFGPEGSQARLAWRVEMRADVPFGWWEIVVDATSGAVLHREDRNVYFVDGTGRVFEPNACIAMRDSTLTDQNDADAAVPLAAYSDVILRDLDDPVGGIYSVSGRYCRIQHWDNPPDTPPTSATPDFSFTRNPDSFEPVNIYYHIDLTQRYFQQLGFSNANLPPNGVNERQIVIDAHGVNGADNSFYQDNPPGAGRMSMGDGGVDDAEDGDVVIHEYGHAVQHNQVLGWGGSCEGGAMGEGFGDYLAGTMHASFNFENECIAMWDATSYSPDNPPCLRRMDTTATWGGNCVQVHADGELWSAALWQCHNAIGRDTFNRTLLESQFNVPPNGGFRDAVLALFDADLALNAGANLDTICQVMVARGFITASECPGPRAAYMSHTIDDSGPGDGDGVGEPGETVTMPVTLRNAGSVPLNNLRATLSSDQPAFITIGTALATWQTPFAVGASATSTSPAYVWSVNPNTPCGTRVTFTLDIVSDEWSGQETFVEVIGSPQSTSGSYPGPAVPIPDNNPGGVTRSITMGAGTVGGVTVTVNITHTYIGDLIVNLTSPTGTVVRLHNMTGGGADNLRRSYPPTVPDGPGTLADFIGEPMAGNWTLFVSDNAAIDTGTLDNWSLDIVNGHLCDFQGGGCAASLPVPTVKVAKLAGGNARMSWAPSTDPCHSRWKVYRSTVSGMKPATPPGTWPTDPLFSDATMLDRDGLNNNPSYDWTPGATLEYFKCVDVGTNGGEGPVGSFGR